MHSGRNHSVKSMKLLAAQVISQTQHSNTAHKETRTHNLF